MGGKVAGAPPEAFAAYKVVPEAVSNVRKELKGAASQVDRWLSDSTGGLARAGLLPPDTPLVPAARDQQAVAKVERRQPGQGPSDRPRVLVRRVGTG